MYGPAEFHDAMVGVPGTHARVLQAIKALRAEGVGVVLKTALSQDTWPYIFDIIQMAKDHDCGMSISATSSPPAGARVGTTPA